MAIPTNPAFPTSRRAMLTAALGAAAASAAGILARPAGVRANDGDGNPLDIGEANTGSSMTSITTPDGVTAFRAFSSAINTNTDVLVATMNGSAYATSAAVKGTNGTGVGVRGTSTNGSGVAGDSLSGAGVFGVSTTGNGVFGSGTNNDAVRGVASGTGVGVSGHSASGHGVVGTTDEVGHYGVHGLAPFVGVGGQAAGLAQAGGGYGVFGTAFSGQSGGGTGVLGAVDQDGTGVLGQAGLESVADTLPGVGVHGTSASGRGVVGSSIESDGVYGETTSPVAAGVRGFSASGYGVWGSSTAGIGVGANSSDVSAMSGRSQSGTKAAILGHSAGPGAGSERTGVMGFSGQTAPAGAPAKTGVYGYAAQDANARGVHGKSTSGRGVYGEATTGAGVRGQATTGTAGYFATTDPAAGFAIQATGRVKFANCAGITTVTGGSNVSAVVTPGIDLATTSSVVATLLDPTGSTAVVQRVAVNATANTFRVYLTTTTISTVRVAWHVFG